MSVYVILRSGKVLEYNNGTRINVEDGCLGVYPKNDEYVVARFPLDVVERAEFGRPCKILKAKPMPKRANY